MNKKLQIAATLLSIILLTGCAPKKDSIYQVSTIVELMKGKFDGNTTLRQLKKNGNFGVGTVNGLDGEFLFVNGKSYHLRGQLRAGIAKSFIKTPYAMVTKFKPEIGVEVVNALDYAQFLNKLDSLIDTQNMLTAIKVEGVFKTIKFRVVPVQQLPYRPLAEVMSDQREVEMQNMEGTLVGFYIPRYMAGINTPGYHFHFISKDKKIGGHVLELALQDGTIDLDSKNYFMLDLNDGKTNISRELKKEELKQNSDIEDVKNEETKQLVEKTVEAPKTEVKKENISPEQASEESAVEQKTIENKEQSVAQPQTEDTIKAVDENKPAPVSPAATEN